MSRPDAIARLKAELAHLRQYDDPRALELRSRDYYWYSPILKEELDDKRADLIVLPTTQDEVAEVAAACARYRVLVTVRGGGTGNYGQCVPLDGGVVLDLTRLDRVLEIAPGRVRVEAGARIARLDAAVHETGQALLMYPSTRSLATIGGFIAGGSGGIGSFRNGVLRDDGTVLSATLLTLEEEPRRITLEGREAHKIQHAYGTNGILLELELGLGPAIDWVHAAALFDGYLDALSFARSVQDAGMDLFLLTCVERRFAPYYTKLKDAFPPDRDAVFAMVAPGDLDRFAAAVAEAGGRLSFSGTLEEIEAARMQPAWELGWNHTTLQALKADTGWTYLQVAYPQPFDMEVVARQLARYGEEVYWHHEMAREGGQVQIFAIPLVRWRGREAMYAMIEEIERLDGCRIFDPHVVTIEGGGMKSIDDTQIAFKKVADPHGLMNPGKTEGWDRSMARP